MTLLFGQDMFESNPKARADMKAGTLYAIAGGQEWIYYGQVNADKEVAFFRRNDRTITTIDNIINSPVMAVITVFPSSITRALRSGTWKKLGRFPVSELAAPRPTVKWPAFTLKVTVWRDGVPSYDTTIDNPAIQMLEVMAVWDAEYHIPARLTADFYPDEALWHVGGPVWRERKVKEETAKRFPGSPLHALPENWILTNRQDIPGVHTGPRPTTMRLESSG
ncbi:hypothetical protein ACQZ6B_11470 [Agrobacterium vitis]